MSHAFAERPVLDDVTFDVPSGVLMGLLGPNGAGKTTLMRIMFGVIDPDAGQTWWQGHPVTTADRRRWGYMPQERGLYPAMPAGDQLVYLARLHGVGPCGGHAIGPQPARRARAWPTGGRTDPTSCPAACSSGCSWPRRSSTTRR